jgi:hypothetical protein
MTSCPPSLRAFVTSFPFKRAALAVLQLAHSPHSLSYLLSLSILERGRQSVYNLLESLVSRLSKLVTTAVDVFEMPHGAHMSRTSEESLEGLIALIADLTIWDVNVESGLLTGRLLHKT